MSRGRPERALLELSACVDPRNLRDPIARRALVRTTRALRKTVKADMWPKPHQIACATFCALTGDRALIADEPGVGKTGPSLLRILLGGRVPALVVAPPNVLLNWKREIEWWIPGLPVHRLDKVDKQVPPAGWIGAVVTTWNLIRYHSRALVQMRPQMVIADECHYALNPKADRTRHFDRVACRSPHLLLLSGTPIVNSTRDLWRLLHLLDREAWPEGSLDRFRATTESAIYGDQSDLTNQVRTYMIRRLKVDALPDLAEKTNRVLTVRLSNEDMALYRRVEQNFSEWLDEKIRSDLDDEEYETEEEFEGAVEDRKARSLASENLTKLGYLQRLVGWLKAPLAARWIVEAAEAGEPLVVFADQPRVLHRIGGVLNRRGIAWGMIAGDTPKTRRYSLVNEFQSGAISVILCTKAGQEGITLSRARHVLRVERYWTGAAEDQSADRIHRIGQTRDVTVWTLIAEGTIDEHMDRVVARKRRVTERTVNTRRVV